MIVQSPPGSVDAPAEAAPDAGVIEEARARQRGQRRIAAVALIAATGCAVLGLGFAGGSGSPQRHPAGTDRHGSGVARVSLASCLSTRHSGKTVQGPPSKSLLSILGVLRRPATPADALPGSALHEFLGSGLGPVRTIFINYVRRARVIDGVSYWVFPEVVSFCGRVRGETMADWVSSGGPEGSGGGMGNATTIAQGEVGGSEGGFGHTLVEMLVPDGVARVKLRYPAGRVGGFDRHQAPATTINTTIVGNLMIVTVPRGGDRLTAPMTMTWYAQDGHAVKAFNRL